MAKANCDLTISQYWEKYKSLIAKVRGWEYAPNGWGLWVCPTMEGYDKMMKKLSPYLQKAISDTTYFELQTAMEKVRNSRKTGPYRPSTMAGYRSLLSDIYRFAQDQGDAYNILAYFTARGKKLLNGGVMPIADIIDPALPKAVMEGRLRAALEARVYLPRSLRPEQQAHLIRLLVDRITEDGRYCGLAIMLYAGLRPAECRALRWKDIVPFGDNPERHMIYVHDSLDHKGKRKGRLKTENGYRKVPVHIELEQILRKRKAFVQATKGETCDISDFPICCMENSFYSVCRDYQLSVLASEVLKKLSITQEELSIYLLDMVAEKDSDREGSGDLHMASYVLRRNFWTWLQSSTQLTNLEKCYVMGHEMMCNGINQRPLYNNPQKLWQICSLMDKHAISLRLHHRFIEVPIHKGQIVSLENSGIIRVKISKEQLASGGELCINVRTNENGDRVILKAQSAIRPFRQLRVEGNVVDWPSPQRASVGINCEYDNYRALEGLKIRGGR